MNLAWPILYLIATAFVVIVPMVASPVETGIGCLMILSSVPVYFVLIAWRNKPKAFQRTMGEFSKCSRGFVANCVSHVYLKSLKTLQALLIKNCKNY